ncbi:MAG TPA: aldose epimerase family protein [Beijerinckiaceae bacterium]|nr:aldose epimerase family protein [Beijerinckiaceae bacterium]
MTARLFGELDGEPVYEVTIRSDNGTEAKVITWGAVIRDLIARAGGKARRVVLGLETLDDYVRHSPYFGAIAGRYANRIAHGRFRFGEKMYQLTRNWKGEHSLHGGARGFGKRPWQLAGYDASSVTLTLFSPDGDEGYPGDLTATCTYRLVGSTLCVELTAAADAATPVNLAQHSHFNLDQSPSILDHTLQLAADFYTPTDADLIPTGEIRAVAGTPYDFREVCPLRMTDPATAGPFHYDINFVLRRDRLTPSRREDVSLAHAATLASRASGVSLEVWTDQPGLQVYDGWMTNVPVAGFDGARYGASSGICLEAQVFPDGPNRPHFPDAILRPGRTYRQVTEYRFS